VIASIAKIKGGASTCRSFTAPGFEHCIVTSDEFYKIGADGTKLTDWVNDIIAGKKVADKLCTSCGAPKP